MRFKITLNSVKIPARIPLNYQYELSAWIYKQLASADDLYATFLHNKGYVAQKKNFKLFTFSNLQPGKYRIIKEQGRMEIQDDCQLMISFYVDKAAEEFIKGLFMNQHLGLGDKISQADFLVGQIELVPLPSFGNVMRYSTLSPLVVSQKSEINKHDDYLSPLQQSFEERFLMNLMDKYQATGQAMQAEWQDFPIGIKILSEPKEKLIKIKANTDAETKIKGYLFDFELSAPKELQEVGYLAGFGRYNAEGFGCVR